MNDQLPCGCKTITVHNALSGREGDTEIVFCKLHSSAKALNDILMELQYFLSGSEGSTKKELDDIQSRKVLGQLSIDDKLLQSFHKGRLTEIRFVLHFLSSISSGG